MTRLLLVGIVALMVGLVLTGCGGGNVTENPATSTARRPDDQEQDSDGASSTPGDSADNSSNVDSNPREVPDDEVDQDSQDGVTAEQLLPIEEVRRIVGNPNIIAKPDEPFLEEISCHYHIGDRAPMHFIVFEGASMLFEKFQKDEYYESVENLGDAGVAGPESVVFTKGKDLIELKISGYPQTGKGLANPEQLLEIARIVDKNYNKYSK